MRGLIKWHRSPPPRTRAGWLIAIFLSLSLMAGQRPALAQEVGEAGAQVAALIKDIERGLSGEGAAEVGTSVDVLTGSLQELLDRSDAGEVDLSDLLKVQARLAIAKAGVRRIKRSPAGGREASVVDRHRIAVDRRDALVERDDAEDRGVVEARDATALLMRGSAEEGEEERSEGVRTLRRAPVEGEAGEAAIVGHDDEEHDDEEVEGIGGAEEDEGEEVVEDEAPMTKRVITRMTMGAGEVAEEGAEGDKEAAGVEALKGQEGFVFGWPVKGVRVTSKYGMRMHPKLKRRKMHKGTDLGGPRGTPVLATGPAKVLRAGKGTGGVGIQVVLEHPGGWVSRYFHLNKVEVEVGDIVKRGDLIGEIGSTGRSTGPHLHFQLEYLGHAMDPQEAIGKRADKIRPKM